MSKLLWGFYLLLTFLVTLPASWWLLSKADFAYPVLYEEIGVAEHIEHFAPRNTKNKLGFEFTTKAQRLQLFHQVSVAIQNHGQGLTQLSYNVDNQAIVLFTSAEVTHLQDVANLLDKLKPLIIGLIILWLAVSLVLMLKKVVLPSLTAWLNIVAVMLILIGATLALGPEKIFNQLHIWVFPDNHQWFFYYEESLMSTMMKAPDLFAYIAGLWGLLSALLTTLMITFLTTLGRKIHDSFK